MTNHEAYLSGIQAAIEHLEEKAKRHNASCYAISALVLQHLKIEQSTLPNVAERSRIDTNQITRGK